MIENKRIGKYEIVEQVGVGGFGIVFKAWDPFIQRWVALKTCNASDKEATQRFFREAQLAGALQHPNITLIYDFGVENDIPYFVQEFLSGMDLDDLVERSKLSLEGILAILLQVCAGLEFAHSRGIIHRDIKPANIRVLEDGNVKIMDFGIAKALDSESRLTQTGVALGTAGYLAPEQLSGRPLDPRTDLFSLGVMAYELITGTRPFAGPNLSNVIYQILNQDPVPPRHRNTECPEKLEKAILKALAKKPDNRYASVRDFAQDIKAILTMLTQKSPLKRADSTAAMVREEVSRLAGKPKTGSTAPTQLSARPFEQVETEAVTQVPPRKLNKIWFLLIVPAAVVVGGGLIWMGLDQGSGGLGLFVQNTPTPLPMPTATATPTPAPAPIPTATPVVKTIELTFDPISEVEIDGLLIGTKVKTHDAKLTIGPHKIVQRIPGWEEKTYDVEVKEDSTRLGPFLLPRYGLLTVMPDRGVPAKGATVYLDGKQLGVLSIIDRKVQVGNHTILVTWPGEKSYEENIEIPALRTKTITVRPN